MVQRPGAIPRPCGLERYDCNVRLHQTAARVFCPQMFGMISAPLWIAVLGHRENPRSPLVNGYVACLAKFLVSTNIIVLGMSAHFLLPMFPLNGVETNSRDKAPVTLKKYKIKRINYRNQLSIAIHLFGNIGTALSCGEAAQPLSCELDGMDPHQDSNVTVYIYTY